jgi:negative regulator of sigma E activity
MPMSCEKGETQVKTEHHEPSIHAPRAWHGPLVLATIIAAVVLTVIFVLTVRIG